MATTRDPLGRVLEIGLVLTLLLAPLPFAAVSGRGRLGLELGAVLLGVVWTIRALRAPTPLPPRAALVGLGGLIALAAVQALPTTPGLVSALAPEAVAIRQLTEPAGEALAAEQRLLGADPGLLAPSPTLSLDPGGTASALRTGAALGLLFLAATTVAATRGARRLALALLVSGAFQALYGLLVLASGHDRIWSLPKTAYLESATGSFVNRNHFACFLAMALACGMALILHNARAANYSTRRRPGAWLFSGEGSRNLILGLLLVVALAGLLASLSRAGIVLGLLALVATVLLAGSTHRVRTRAVIAVLVLGAGSVPLAQLGFERLRERYVHSADDLTRPGSRAMVWSDTLSMAASHPWVGTGYGTYGAVYPLYRSPEVRRFFAHAHNDPLQALAEGGLLGLVFLALLLAPVISTMTRSLGGAKGALAVGLAAGLAALLLHGLIDFNLHIPANAAAGAVLAGTLLGLPWNEPS